MTALLDVLLEDPLPDTGQVPSSADAAELDVPGKLD
jgi:hypothetical protein